MNFQIKSIKLYCLALIGVAALSQFSCDIDEISDPNGPSVSAIINNATRSDLNSVVSGIEFFSLDEVDFYMDVSGIIGREVYFFTAADVRFTGELLGKEQLVLDNAAFYGTRPYQGRYRTIKNTNILIEAVNNNADRIGLSQPEVNGYIGFAKAMQAYELHLALMLQYQNGIRTDVADPDNLGAFRTFEESLTDIRAILDDAISLLGNAEMPFVLSAGYTGFNTAPEFVKFVNGIAARIAIYQNDKAEKARGYLANSFMDMNGDFNTGPQREYSTAGGEQPNELFRNPGASEALVAHPDLIAALQANPNDARNAKIQSRGGPISSDGLTSDHDVVLYASQDDNVAIMRNEELILLAAEANIGFDNVAALDAINVVRTRHGLDAVALTTDAELVDELLDQRRLSLFYEGHRWVDMRRYNRLSELPIDRANDDVWEQLPRPVSEVN